MKLLFVFTGYSQELLGLLVGIEFLFVFKLFLMLYDISNVTNVAGWH